METSGAGTLMGAREQEIAELIRAGENLQVEFKSDRSEVPTNDLVEEVVALANTKGGVLLLGVEDDGECTGLHPKRQDLRNLEITIASRTHPTATISIHPVQMGAVRIARIRVEQSRQPVATSKGTLKRRSTLHDGTPATVPFYPSEHAQRQSGLGLLDPSTMPFPDVAIGELDPLQRHRIRSAIKEHHGDQALLPLADDELDGALGLVTEVSGQRCPTLAGLLLLGTEALLRRHVPSYEVAFQMLQGTKVLVNQFFRKPLLETFQEVERQFHARIVEEEIDVGFFRVPVPNYDRVAFREAFVNALVHRDFHRLGAVHVRLDGAGLTISSPGGFIEGVNLRNLLVAAPKSRNPSLADIIKRIGLAERTGRGIDRIFEGTLLYGRPAPDYSQSDDTTVTVYMTNAEADLPFRKMIAEQRKHLGDPPTDALIILNRLREEPHLTVADIAPSVQKPEAQTRDTLEELVVAGVLKARDSGDRRRYILNAELYPSGGQNGSGGRQANKVMDFVNQYGTIRRTQVMTLCRLNGPQAYRLLNQLVKSGKLEMRGARRSAYYARAH